GEEAVANALTELLDQGQPVSVLAVEARLGKPAPAMRAALGEVVAVDFGQYDRLFFDSSSAADGAGAAEEDKAMSLSNSNMEVNDGSGEPCGPGEGPAGIMFGGDADAVRGRGPAGGGGVVDLPAVSSRTGAAGVPATTPQADRALAEGVKAAAG